jgi:heme-transporting ATPase
MRYHPAASIGYYDQSLQQLADDATLPDALYPFASLSETARSDTARKQALISAGFPYSRHHQKVSTLSGGERARLLFLALSLASYHLLFLDEPTNHLDMDGKRELSEALQGFEGGCLLVSHDRDLIEQGCNRFWVVHDGKLEQWQDAADAYRRLSGTTSVVPERKAEPSKPLQASSDDEQALDRLCELEQMLEEDLARKPRHQKPALQAEWRTQIAALTAQLGL